MFNQNNKCWGIYTVCVVANLVLTACPSDESLLDQALACENTSADSQRSNSNQIIRIDSTQAGYEPVPVYHQINASRDGNVSLVYMVHEPPSGVSVKALLLMIPGGTMFSEIVSDTFVDGTPATGAGGNYLVRSAHLYAVKGYRVVTIQAPSDYINFVEGGAIKGGYSLDSYRTSSAHRSDLADIIAAAKDGDDGLSVAIVGTSRGALSAVTHFDLGFAIVLSNPVTGGKNGIPVSAGSAKAVSVPTLVMWHAGDGCSVSPASGSNALVDNFPDASGKGVKGGFEPGNDLCGGLSHHGFLGIESCASQQATDWIDSFLTGV